MSLNSKEMNENTNALPTGAEGQEKTNALPSGVEGHQTTNALPGRADGQTVTIALPDRAEGKMKTFALPGRIEGQTVTTALTGGAKGQATPIALRGRAKVQATLFALPGGAKGQVTPIALTDRAEGQEPNVLPSAAGGNETTLDETDDKSKAQRHPRWTREEIFVLIKGKTVVENQLQKNRRFDSPMRSDQFEPKWELVSSYCKEKGVIREAYQCQKRWSNLICDFKKIKLWETQKQEELESFWIMRNDKRKERKLPGFFDKEVYNILNKNMFAAGAIPLTSVAWAADMQREEGIKIPGVEGEGNNSQEPAEDAEATDYRWFAVPVQFTAGNTSTNYLQTPELANGKRPQPESARETVAQDMKKRTHLSSDGTYEDRLINVLQNTNDIMEAQLRAYNRNCLLNRQQEAVNNEGVVAALNKIGDALVRISDKI